MARDLSAPSVEADGSLRGSFLVPAGDSETVLTALEPLARPAGVQDRPSAAQRRADALVEVFEQALRHGELPDAGGFRPQLSYVLPADWGTRQAGEHDCTSCRRCPQHRPPSFAELVAAGIPAPRRHDATGGGHNADDADDLVGPARHDGCDRALPVPGTHGCAVAAWTGPQTRGRVETMLCDARITCVLLDSLGQVTGLESLGDGVTTAQRRALAARDLGCAARGCTRPPAMCDAHHLDARADGGDTGLHNLVLLCRRHHVLWHLGTLTLDDLHVPWISADRRALGPPGRRPSSPLVRA